MAFKDLTDAQVLDLDDVDVEDIIAREIMEQGVKKVDEPAPFLLQKPALKKEKFYEANGVLFKTMGQAEKFTALQPYRKDYHWNIGTEFHYSNKSNVRIEVVELYDETELLEMAQDLQNWNRAYQDWQTHKNRYDSYLRSKSRISKEVWDRVTNVRAANRELQEIRDAYYEYIKLANGDKEIAQKFLFKTYGEEKGGLAMRYVDALDLPAPTEEAEQIAEEANA